MVRRWGAWLLLCLAFPALLHAQTADTTTALAYVRSQQAADGSFAGFGAGSTADAVYALVAAGVQPATFRNTGETALAGLRTLAPGAATTTGGAAKFALALLMAGETTVLSDGSDLLTVIEQGRNSATGQYGSDVSAHAFALLALRAAGRPAARDAAPHDALKKLQLPDGGWSFAGSAATGSDTNTTALAIQALIAVEGPSAAVSRAVAYLKTQQNSDGGFPFSQASAFGTASDANSTAYVIQGLIAAGEDPNSVTKHGKSPLDRLRAFQNSSGAFRYQDTPPDDNAGATYQALPALLGKTFPLSALSAPAAPVPTTPGLPSTGLPSFPAWALVAAAVALVLTGRRLVRR